MKNLLLLKLFLFYLVHSLHAQENTKVNVPDSKTIEAWMNDFNIPAVGIGILENGQVQKIIVKGELKKGSPAPENAIFDVASLTKSLVTNLTLQLVSKGKWDLDEPLYHYWIDPDVKDDPLHKKLTTRHVLSHSTGFVNWRWMHESKKLTFDYEPGSKVSYSGEGFVYLQRALEKKFKSSLDQLIQSNIFDPYGMSDSHLIWNDRVDSSRLAIGHNAEKKPYPYEKIYQANAADDMLTTVQDLGKFGEKVLIQKGLTEEIFQEMIRPHSQVKEGVSFGLGWIVLENLSGGEYALFNAGGDQGVGAIILLLPQSKRGLIVMTNGDQGRALVMKAMVQMVNVGKDIVSRF